MLRGRKMLIYNPPWQSPLSFFGPPSLILSCCSQLLPCAGTRVLQLVCPAQTSASPLLLLRALLMCCRPKLQGGPHLSAAARPL